MKKNVISRFYELLLKELDITQSELARKIGVPKQYVNRCLHQKTHPSAATLMKIVSAYGDMVYDIAFKAQRGAKRS